MQIRHRRAHTSRSARAVHPARLAVGACVVAMLFTSCGPAPPAYRTVPDGWGDAISADHVDVAYGPHPAHRLDIYRSRAGSSKGTIVFVHGGGWNAGDKSDRDARPDALLAQTRRGYDFVTINYRLAGQASAHQGVADVASALRWVRSGGRALGLDTSTIVLAGFSAGAHLATLAAVSHNDRTPAGDVPRVDGVVALAGAFDLRSLPDAHLPGLRAWYPSLADRHAGSPVRWLDAADPPIFAAHGVEDNILPVDQLRTLRRRATQVGAARQLVAIEVSDRGLPAWCRSHPVSCGVPMDRLDRFLDRL